MPPSGIYASQSWHAQCLVSFMCLNLAASEGTEALHISQRTGIPDISFSVRFFISFLDPTTIGLWDSGEEIRSVDGGVKSLCSGSGSADSNTKSANTTKTSIILRWNWQRRLLDASSDTPRTSSNTKPFSPEFIMPAKLLPRIWIPIERRVRKAWPCYCWTLLCLWWLCAACLHQCLPLYSLSRFDCNFPPTSQIASNLENFLACYTPSEVSTRLCIR